ncbi:MAG: hypothetical protein OXG35_21390 [Acidobacteria bacterium]|nr:hypothetical protein [Acidobacteriota bacterium]
MITNNSETDVHPKEGRKILERARAAGQVLVPVLKRDGTTALLKTTADELEVELTSYDPDGKPPWDVDEANSTESCLTLDVPVTLLTSIRGKATDDAMQAVDANTPTTNVCIPGDD